MEDQASFYQLSDPNFRAFLYKSLKARVEIIEDTIYTDYGAKLRQIELENYQNYQACIEQLQYKDFEPLADCQVQFQKRNVLSYLEAVVEKSKDSLYECMNDKYLQKESKVSDESRVNRCLDTFEAKVYKTFDSI
jgi:hypothetical protein